MTSPQPPAFPTDEAITEALRSALRSEDPFEVSATTFGRQVDCGRWAVCVEQLDDSDEPPVVSVMWALLHEGEHDTVETDLVWRCVLNQHRSLKRDVREGVRVLRMRQQQAAQELAMESLGHRYPLLICEARSHVVLASRFVGLLELRDTFDVGTPEHAFASGQLQMLAWIAGRIGWQTPKKEYEQTFEEIRDEIQAPYGLSDDAPRYRVVYLMPTPFLPEWRVPLGALLHDDRGVRWLPAETGWGSCSSCLSAGARQIAETVSELMSAAGSLKRPQSLANNVVMGHICSAPKDMEPERLDAWILSGLKERGAS